MSSARLITVRDRTRQYLDGQRSLADFQEWLVDELWSIEAEKDADAQRLAYRIENRIAEHTSCYCSEAELKRALGADLRDVSERLTIAGRA